MNDAFSPFAATIAHDRYLHDLPGGGKEVWGRGGLATRVSTNVLGAVSAPKDLVDAVEGNLAERIFMAGGRYLSQTGRPYHQTQNCLLKSVEDTREAWATHAYKVALGLMTGAGIGTVYTKCREEGAPIRKTGGVASGPISLMEATNDASRKYRQGGNRRGALWAGLHWNHPDIMKFIELKNWSPEVRALKARDFNFPAPMDITNISVILDDLFFEAYFNSNHALHSLAHMVYWKTVRQMMKTGEPGFSIDVGIHAGEHNRNACTEICSADDDDICNLGSINLARIKSLSHFEQVIETAMGFLVAGSVYSDVPYPEVGVIREKNRRIGLGLMGVHEWLLTRGHKYGPNDELSSYLKVYQQASDYYGDRWADRWSLSRPKAKRGIAPNGTIGICAETTPSADPLLCAAYKRRYAKGSMGWAFQYVIDPVAQRLVQQGIEPDSIEDAYTLAEDVERRVAFQAYLQQYVDHCISTTLNLPAWGTEHNNDDRVRPFGEMLMKYLPKLRGITCYPDGARGGQPLQAVRYHTAAKHLGKEMTEGEDEVAFEQVDVCDITRGASCG
jgi:ribonucleoside-diphosphate reductase alpha chain